MWSYVNSYLPVPPPLAIHGKNFGYIEAPVSISIANVSCDNPTWGNDGQVTCQPQQDVVGYKNMTILAARQVRTWRGAPALVPCRFGTAHCLRVLQAAAINIYDFQGYVLYQCQTGYYGLAGELCLPCPTGARCPGFELRVDRVQVCSTA